MAHQLDHEKEKLDATVQHELVGQDKTAESIIAETDKLIAETNQQEGLNVGDSKTNFNQTSQTPSSPKAQKLNKKLDKIDQDLLEIERKL